MAAGDALLTDLYQLTMLQGYFRESLTETASFEFFIRSLPSSRNFFVAAGLEQLLEYLSGLAFSAEDCDWLRSTGHFAADFLEYLRDLRFTGNVSAMPEGTICFPNEPLVRITAPLPEAQIVETRLINLLQFQTMIASKAVRSVIAARGRTVVDFGLRRAHGAEAGLLAARASYLAGFAGTSNVLAGRRFGIPLFGTMAHSYVMAHDSEAEAFVRFVTSQPVPTVLLIDTYDTLRAAQTLVQLAPCLLEQGFGLQGVRIDSGDLMALSRSTRDILDKGGLTQCQVVVSGDLDEYAVHDLMAAGAPIDGFGIGTQLVTSADVPVLNCAYKLEEYAGRPRRKRSPGRQTLPGQKQVFRAFDEAGRMRQDVIELCDHAAEGEPLLTEVMRGGQRISATEPLNEIRARVAQQLQKLPDSLQTLERAEPYPVFLGHALAEMVDEMEQSGR
ncbi:nicotinate phosphoribosyltransferase [Methylolobus aquaticus]